MFCTISTWEPRVSAKQTASTPRADVDALPKDRPGVEEGPVYALARGIDAAGELSMHFAPFGHEVVVPQLCRPHPVRTTWRSASSS